MKTSALISDANRLLLPIILLGSLALTSCETMLETPEIRCNHLAEEASRATQSNNYSEAEGLYQQAVKEAEKSGNLLQLPSRLDDLSAVYIHENKKEEAEGTLDRAIDIYRSADKGQLPSYDSLLVQQLLTKDCALLANLEVQLGKLLRAEELYKRALAESAKDVEEFESRNRILKDYALLLRNTHREKEAYEIETTLAANDLDAKDWDQMYRIVRDYYLDGDYEPSKEKSISGNLDILAQSTKQFKGRRARTYYLLAVRQLAMRRPAEAEKHIRQSLEFFQTIDDKVGPNGDERFRPIFHADILTVLAHTLELQGKNKEADEKYQRALAINKEIPVGRLMSLTNFYKTRNPSEVNKLSERIISLIHQQRDPLPSNVNALIDLAKLRHQSGQKKEALALFKETVAVDQRIKNEKLSDKAYFYTYLADGLVGCGYTSEAEGFYQKGIKLCLKEKLYKAWVCGTCIRRYASVLRLLKRTSEAARIEPTAKSFAIEKKKEPQI